MPTATTSTAKTIATKIHEDIGDHTTERPAVLPGRTAGLAPTTEIIRWPTGPRAWIFTWPNSPTGRATLARHNVLIDYGDASTIAGGPAH